jgi:anti-sigma regulatory factor (Ser/Thr protein kinase)
MKENILFHKVFVVKGSDFANAGEASVEVKNILKDVGFEPDTIRRVAIASYEAEMNMVMYGEGGDMDLVVKPDLIVLTLQDQGPGIPDIDLAMQEGYSTATEEMREMGFGAGMGLPNIKKNTDDLKIETDPKRGTRLEMIIRNR